MAVKDAAPDFSLLQDCWFPQFLNLALAQMTSQEQQQAIDWVNIHVFDAALVEPTHRMNVMKQSDALYRIIRIGLEHRFNRCGKERTERGENHAACIYGNLVCRVGVGRCETWRSFPQPVTEDRFSRTYVLETHIAARIN